MKKNINMNMDLRSRDHYKLVSVKTKKLFSILKLSPTVIGYCALLIWSLSAVATVHVRELPVLEVLTLTFMLAFITTCVRLTVAKEWSTINQPWYIWVIGVLGVCLQQFFYMRAFQNGPAAEVDVIIYLWPLLLLLFSGFLPKEKLRIRHIVSGLMCFFSLMLLNAGAEGVELHQENLVGYGYALVCALLWSGYTLSARYFKNVPSYVVGLYYGIGSIFAFIGHIVFESFVMPTPEQGIVLLFMGVLVCGCAYYFWDYGVKKGNMKFLAILSYFNPILSIGFLALILKIDLHPNIGVACLLIALGGLLGSKLVRWSSFKSLTFLKGYGTPLELK